MVKVQPKDGTSSALVDQCDADLLSDLPKNVIYGIMERLPLQTAAKMSVLSQKWRDNWLSLPCLVFGANLFRNVDDEVECCSLVSKVLLQHSGRPISKFSLDIPRFWHPKREVDVGQWLPFLFFNGIRDLTLRNRNVATIKLPFSLFLIQSLEKLKLTYFVLRSPASFKGFRCLLSLHLQNIAIEGNNFEHFIASCPLLEELTLRHWTGFDRLHINAPNLKYLSIFGSFHYINLGSSKKLSAVSIYSKELVHSLSRAEDSQLIKFFACSCRIEKLSFGGYLVKSLAAGDISKLLSTVTFNHVKHLMLRLKDSSSELSTAVDIIQRCPNIQDLSISVTAKNDDFGGLKLEYDMSSKFLQLKSIEATVWKGSNEELRLIEFLLACSPSLKTCNLIIRTWLDKSAMLRFSKRFERSEKASPNILFMIYMLNKDEDDSSSSHSSAADDDDDYDEHEDDDDDDDDYSSEDEY